MGKCSAVLIGLGFVVGVMGFTGRPGAEVGVAQLLFVFDIALFAMTLLFFFARKNSV